MIRIFLKILEPLVPWLNVLNSDSKEDDNSDTNQLNNQPSCSSTSNEQNIDCKSSDNKTDDLETSKSRTGPNTETELTENSANFNSSCNDDDNRNVEGQSGLSKDSALSDNDEKDRQDLNLIYNIMKGFIYDYMFSLYMVSRQISHLNPLVRK